MSPTSNKSASTCKRQAIAVRNARAERGESVVEGIAFLGGAMCLLLAIGAALVEVASAATLIGVAVIGTLVVVAVWWLLTAAADRAVAARHEEIKAEWGAYLLDNGGWPAAVDVFTEVGHRFLDRWQHADDLAGTRRDALAYDDAVVALDRSHRDVRNALRSGR